MNVTVELSSQDDRATLDQELKQLLDSRINSGQVLRASLEDRAMSKGRRRGIGAYLIVLGLSLLTVLPWAWSTASRAMGASAGRTVKGSFLIWKYAASADFALVVIVMLAALLGSVVVLALTFSARAGHETLERGFLWWYLTRPISAAGLGLLFYLSVIAGFFNSSTTNDRPALVVAAAIGGLAGLFTDQVLKKMRAILGLLPTEEPASGKKNDNSGT